MPILPSLRAPAFGGCVAVGFLASETGGKNLRNFRQAGSDFFEVARLRDCND
jgi:hypothetical protein